MATAEDSAAGSFGVQVGDNIWDSSHFGNIGLVVSLFELAAKELCLLKVLHTCLVIILIYGIIHTWNGTSRQAGKLKLVKATWFPSPSFV